MAKIVLLTNGRGKFCPVTEASFKANKATFEAERMRPATEKEIAQYEGAVSADDISKPEKEADKKPAVTKKVAKEADKEETKSKGAK